MVYKNTQKDAAKYNEKWLSRDVKEVLEKRKAHGRKVAKHFNGKSPQIQVSDKITWKRPSKHG